MTTIVEASGEGPVVVKRGGHGEAPRLRLEGERLRRASHPGVVQLLSSGPVDDGWELRTAHAGRPLSALCRPSLQHAAALVAAASSTLADLHQLGIVHGRLDASHVLVGDQGRPVLCGFGDGSALAQAEDDVAGLGALLGELIDGDTEAEPIPDRRWRRPRGWSGWDRRCLLLLVDQACAEPTTRRPTARRLAAAITDAVPDLAPPVPPAVSEKSGAPSASAGVEPDAIARLRRSTRATAKSEGRRAPALWLGAVGIALLAAGVLRWRSQAPTDAGSRQRPAPATASPDDRQASETLEDSVLEVDGRRYRVGRAGDEVLVGDWDCDGTATPALLRPATGEVFVFPRWVERAELAVEPVLQVVGAEGLVSQVTPGGCPSLAAETAAGDLVPVTEEGSL